MFNGAGVNNLAGGTFELLADGTFSGGGAFNNTGTFRKSPSGTSQFGTAIPPQGPDFNNTGLVDVVSGQLNLMGGASSGVYHTEAGGVLWFWGGTHTFSSGASFTGPGFVRLYQGASSPQWLVTGAISVAELELGLNGLLVGNNLTPANPVTVGTLILSANGLISNGIYTVTNAQVLDGSACMGLTLTVVSNLLVGGTNCLLSGSTLQIAASASATFSPVLPDTTPVLTLAQGSVVTNLGSLSLNGASLVVTGAVPQSKLVISPSGILSATNLTFIKGSASGHLIIDNSGLIRADGGTLRFDGGIDWRCGAGIGEFSAAAADSLILFASGFNVDGGSTNLFTGAGTNYWSSSGTNVINGTAQVGAIDAVTRLFSTGNLEIFSSCSGTGSVHVLGSSAQAAALKWNDGTLSQAALNLDTNALMLISGGGATNRQLSGCFLSSRGNILLLDQATVICGNGATFFNYETGTLDMQTDGALTAINANSMLSIQSRGRLVKSGGAQTGLIAANLYSSGAIEAKAGTLQFQGFWSQTGGTTTVDGGAVLAMPKVSIDAGTLTGSGTIQAKVYNGGVTTPGGSPGTLTLGPGDDYQQGAGATLRIELGGYTPGTEYDQLVVGGNATLAGTLELRSINGFVPQPGDEFQVLTCGSQTGQFSRINSSALTNVICFARYSGTNVSVFMMSRLMPVVSGGTLSFSIFAMPGFSYRVQASDSLNPPNWQTLEEFAGDGSTKTIPDPATGPQRFYRVLFE